METLANLESFVRSADGGSFSAAARRLGLSPAAVSRNVAMLERNLGVRLFQRSTRRLSLTEAGERFLAGVRGNLEGLQAAIEAVGEDGEPAGVLRLSLSPAFGAAYILPMLPAFLARYPKVRTEWVFENRAADLVGEGLDAAIGGGFDLAPGLVARMLAPAHIVAVASPGYLAERDLPSDPSGLSEMDGILMRPARTGRVRHWTMRDASGAEMLAAPRESVVFNDPGAMVQAAVLGMGVTLAAVPDVLPYLERGELVRLCPRWWADAGAISIYYSGRALLPARTRAFVDHVAAEFRAQRLPERLAGSVGSV